MTIAIPTFGSRVAPTFLHSETLQLARVIGTKTVSVETLPMKGLTENERIKLLEDRRVSILVCGGIGRDLAEELEGRGIDVIQNVAGETEQVLAHLARGEIRSGFGITYHPSRADANAGNAARAAVGLPAIEDSEEEQPAIDCLACSARPCVSGEPCPNSPGARGTAAPARAVRQTIEVATDIAAEPERILCRISELVYFCLGMNYNHIGLAFCVELFREAEIIGQLLSRFVRVTPVCCRVDVSPAPGEAAADNGAALRCNPVGMARHLNHAQTDLNVLIGLCMGSDVVFTQMSAAPVTTLFVKDRLLANNPIAAVHSRYVLDQVINTT